MGGSHTEGETGVRVGVSVLNSRVKASEITFGLKITQDLVVSPGPGLFRADQVALQWEGVSRNKFVNLVQTQHVQLCEIQIPIRLPKPLSGFYTIAFGQNPCTNRASCLHMGHETPAHSQAPLYLPFKLPQLYFTSPCTSLSGDGECASRSSGMF